MYSKFGKIAARYGQWLTVLGQQTRLLARRSLLGAVLMIGLVAASMLEPVVATGDAPTDYKIKVEQVDPHDFPLVTLYVTVKDQDSDELVPGLTQDQFLLKEDGKEVKIVDFSAGNLGPIFTVLTIDRSGSMEVENKMQGAKEAAHAFIDMMRPQDQVALITFDEQVTLWQDFTNQQTILHQRVDAIGIGGCTAWYDGVWETVDHMAGVSGRRNAILLSDGIDCREGGLLQQILGGDGSQHSFDEAIAHANAAEVAIHTIGLGARVSQEVSNEGFDEEKLKRMAAETGGTYHHAPSARQLRALYESFAEVTQKEYVITFESGRADYDGTRRNIEVSIGENSGGGDYVEKHLLNVKSTLPAALLFAAPLVFALLIPAASNRISRSRSGRRGENAPLSQDFGESPGSAGWPGATEQPSGFPRQAPASPNWPASQAGGTPAGFVPAQPAPLACPGCGRPVRPGSRFCPTCGTDLTRQPPAQPHTAHSTEQATAGGATCPTCGNPLRPGARFCSRCGQRSAS